MVDRSVAQQALAPKLRPISLLVVSPTSSTSPITRPMVGISTCLSACSII